MNKVREGKNFFKGVPSEIEFQYTKKIENPYMEFSAELEIKSPTDKIINIPLFWKIRDRFAVRICLFEIGKHHYRIKGDFQLIKDLDKKEGSFEVNNYFGSNPLFIHGPLRVSENNKYLCHLDGKPFFWLADTWWFGATNRCRWPDDFQLLVQDRVKKGFNVVQMVVGIPPEVSKDDSSISNEGGYPFNRKWDLINPNYFEYIDKRIEYLSEAGIVACIYGGWGYHIDWMSEHFMTRYWNYLVARYAAYPVVWCLCGELERKQWVFSQEGQRSSVLPDFLKRKLYNLAGSIKDTLWKNYSDFKEVIPLYWLYLRKRREKWTKVGKSVLCKDPFINLITAHPIKYVYSHESLSRRKWVGFTSIQSGHSETSRFFMVNAILKGRQKFSHLPIINLEPWYEGIRGSFWADEQRYAFWMSLLAGAFGYSYGANGVWQMGKSDNFLSHWGNANWRGAYKYDGAHHIGISKRFLEKFEWWKIQPCLHMIQPSWGKGTEQMPMMASIYNSVYFIYFSKSTQNFSFNVNNFPPKNEYGVIWFNPRNGAEINIFNSVVLDNNPWTVPVRPDNLDWVMVMHSKNYR